MSKTKYVIVLDHHDGSPLMYLDQNQQNFIFSFATAGTWNGAKAADNILKIILANPKNLSKHFGLLESDAEYLQSIPQKEAAKSAEASINPKPKEKPDNPVPVQTADNSDDKAEENSNVQVAQLPMAKRKKIANRASISADSVNDLRNVLADLDEYICNIDERIKECNAIISVEDARELDYMHYIEFNNLNAPKAAHLFKEFKESRLRRRAAKDMLSILTDLQPLAASGSAFDLAAKSANRCLPDARHYAPRVEAELFEPDTAGKNKKDEEKKS